MMTFEWRLDQMIKIAIWLSVRNIWGREKSKSSIYTGVCLHEMRNSKEAKQQGAEQKARYILKSYKATNKLDLPTNYLQAERYREVKNNAKVLALISGR